MFYSILHRGGLEHNRSNKTLSTNGSFSYSSSLSSSSLVLLLLLSVIVVVSSFMVTECSASLPIPFYTAILDPENYHERIRVNEYDSTKPFYQWWYFWLRDEQLNRHYAFTYALSLCKGRTSNENECKYDGFFVLFAVVDHSTRTSFQKVERFPYSSLHTVNDGSHFHLQVFNPSNSSEMLYELKPLKDGQYQIFGNMRKNSPNLFFTDKIDNSLNVNWNLTIDRIYGYYGQKSFEMPDEKFRGIIMWNTYSHDSLVNGILNYQSNSISNTIIQPIHDRRWRFYCDMNFGQFLPLAPDNDFGDRKYAWGWYYANIPSNNIENELSVIAGTGRTYAMFPLGTMDARFADIRLNKTHHIELTQLIVYGETFYYTNDGKVLTFDVHRSNWTTITDTFGSAEIPLKQTCVMETEHYLVVIDFESKFTDYNRLLFPLKDQLFSDFEGLGVKASLSITYKPTKQAIVNNVDVTSTSGLEFGYGVNTKLPTTTRPRMN
ncbi:predicted protein [Naegleria gruberi]|uniref:Predicted protein n=1 Tax=Naegleria gruberi TaxID=5762 RepID=D2VVJ4_NAEGR|nr:uncharacterized protein NAEGRDRAFT_73040 [Naegleria gruberi]EFC39122.1 predicted protein [Naegleria gruberi]|eukprot:XP_002671866.1 predicted protein [Naegleria gruberi strain NEG-M]